MKAQKIFVLCLITLSLGSCRTDFNFGCIKPEGDVETRTIEFGEFDEVSTNFDSDVTIKEGSFHEVIITAHTNIIDRIIEDSSNNGDLDLEINGCSRINNDDRPKIEITMPELSQLQIKGDGSMVTDGLFGNVEDLQLKIDGDGFIDFLGASMDRVAIDIKGDGEIIVEGICEMLSATIQGDGDIEAQNLIANVCSFNIDGDGDGAFEVTEEFLLTIKGDGKATVSGTADNQEIKIQGDGRVMNFDLESLVTVIDIQGDGNCEVTVLDELEVKISGDGNVCYKGSPILDTDISGDGKVNNCN